MAPIEQTHTGMACLQFSWPEFMARLEKIEHEPPEIYNFHDDVMDA